MAKEELEKENANLKALRKYELNVAKLEIEKLEQRNAELEKEKCELLGIIQGKDKVIQEFEKENAKLKKQVENRNCSNCRLNKTGCPNDGSCHNFSLWQPWINPKLTKAKEIIKNYLTIVKGSHTTVCGVPEANRTIYVLQLNEEAEEFLNSEVEQ